MQANKWPGMILPGPPGTAKSLFATALAAEHEVPCIALDLGAMKGSLVGQSEQQIRAALKVIRAVAGKGAYWVATCNRMESLPPELRRRFTDGIRFFDLPDEAERASIWTIMRKKFKIKETDSQPDDHQWTGADIRNVCALAYRLKVSLKKAATYITPVAKSDPHSIERLRKLAHNSFLSASREGLYQMHEESPTTGRMIG
jgi:SpoVK/Ycf46/Vps4 family AAA+-type ATPase